MYHYHEAITNNKGDALIGYYVRAVDAASGAAASLYADESATPIISVSGIANAALVDSDGNVSFWINGGTYHLDIYATDGTSFVRRISSIPMVDFQVAAGFTADRTHLAAITGVVGDAYTLTESGREGTFVWSSSNLSTQVTADPNQGIYVAPTSDTTGASGAWVRKYDPAPSVRWFGAVGNGTTDDQPAIRQAIVTLGSLGLSKLHVPALTYKLGAQVQVDVSNLVIEAWGAKFTAAFTTGQGIIYIPPGHDNIRIIGLHFRLTGEAQTRGTTTATAPIAAS
jgi:hypothetical protein